MRLVLLIILVGITIFGLRAFRAEAGDKIISPLMDEVTDEVNTAFSDLFPKNQPRSNDQLMQGMKEFLGKQKGVYSIYYYDLSKNNGFGINETTIFTAASVIKLPILAALYYEADKQNLDLDRRITLQSRDIQDFGTGVLRYEGAGGSYSLKTLAQLLIEKSDNTAGYVLTQVIGEKRIQELVEQWGLTQTDIAMNKTTSKDIGMLLIKMYQGQITSEALTQEMIGFMDDSDFENRLPALLPEDTKVYHKIGNEVGNIHDVGIIMHPKKPYILGVMTNDIIDERAAEAAIAQLSKYTYDFVAANP